MAADVDTGLASRIQFCFLSLVATFCGMETSDSLRAMIAQQNEKIESLGAAAQKYRSRVQSLEQQLIVKQAEIDSLQLLASENAAIRDENLSLREKVDEIEQHASRMAEHSSHTTESQAQLGVKVQAYQRHNNFLQSELALREAKIKAMQEKMDVLTEELLSKDRRITILVEKLRQHNIDPTASVSKINVPEEQFARMKERLASQSQALELLREKTDTQQEDLVRKEEVIAALNKENAALRQSVSKLISQLGGTTSALVTASGTPRNEDSRVKTYHARKMGDFSNN